MKNETLPDKDMVDRAENIKNRQDIVLGACLAVVAGFLVNTFSNIFYDIAISRTLSVSDVSAVALSVLFVLLILFEAFLEFLIYDVRQGQDTNINTIFWGRFFDFIDEKHWANKAAMSMFRMMWTGFKVLFWAYILISFLAVEYYAIALIFISTTVIYRMARRGFFNKYTKKGKL